MRRARARDLARNPALLLAFGLGSGLSPKAPGTVGSLAALALYYPLLWQPWVHYLAVVLVGFVLGIWLCGYAARWLGVHDHGGIVWDEFIGLWLTLWLCPPDWWWPLLGFALFRLFDIAKPWPIRWLDRRVGGGFGIMLDDVVAGLLAWLVLQGFAWWWLGPPAAGILSP